MGGTAAQSKGPCSNTGLRTPEGRGPALIDFISLTLPGSGLWRSHGPSAYLDADKGPIHTLRRLGATVSTWGYNVRVEEPEPKGRFGYSWSAAILDESTGEEIGFCLSGGNNFTAHVSITGSGCGLISPDRVRDFLERVGGRLTRIDIAVDDYHGTRTPHTVREAFLDGQFDTEVPGLGRMRPTPGQAGPWDSPDLWHRGLTYYVGKRGSRKMLRVYHKGREQGDPNSDWTRFEVEYRANKTELSLDLLTDPLSGFVSAYPWLSWAAEEEETVSIGFIRKERGRANLRHLLFHARRSYGKLLHVMRSTVMRPVSGRPVGERIKRDISLLNALQRVGKPSRLDVRYLWREGEIIDGVGVFSYV